MTSETILDIHRNMNLDFNENSHQDVKLDIDETDCVAVIGTGNFGKAIASKLVKCGIKVVIGTRNPEGPFVSIEKALQEKIVVLAVPPFSWHELPLVKVKAGTVIIDCSNRSQMCPVDQQSQAELLQLLLPTGVFVVKGFNTISAYELENQNFSAGEQIPIAGNSRIGKELVGRLLDRLGYHVSDMGRIEEARKIENIPLSLFPTWKKPLFVSCIIWTFLYALTFSRYHFCSDNQFGWYPKNMRNMIIKYVNKTCDSHALILLAACYLPGVLAAYLQLFRGTKYSTFPLWLDGWLKMRKQFGILMLLSASLHACFYLLFFHPREDTILANLYICTGVLAYFAAVTLGITSLPSVSTSLSWKEFRTIQSWLGWFCLILATSHCIFNGWKKLLQFNDCIFLSSEQLPLILPAITILLKIPLLLPCVDSRLTQIRQGKVF